MGSRNLSFLGKDPGAVKYGNFINYYSFHSTTQRLDHLRPDMFPPMSEETLLCLDIGCNTGDLSKEIYLYIKTLYPKNDVQMLAVDIDSILIERAQEAHKDSSITFTTANIMTESGQDVVKRFLDTYKRQCFNITFCFSVTMWIHINNGDEGLEQFLEYLKVISDAIIVEPQPWTCYRNAQRRMIKSGSRFPLYKILKIRGNVVSTIENTLSRGTHKKVFESSSSSWKRKIQSYQQIRPNLDDN